MCCSINFALLHRQIFTLRFLPSIVIFQYKTPTMLTLFPEQAEIIRKKPQQLSKISYDLLLAATIDHHPHNRLLPACDVQHLLNIFSSSSLASTNTDAAFHLLAANCISMVLKTNFGQLTQNKLYGAFVLQYGQILQKLIEELRKSDLQGIYMYTKLAARGIVLSKIILKLIERTHAFLPEYYRFIRVLLDALSNVLFVHDISSQAISDKEKGPTLILRICFSKKVTRYYIIYLFSSIQKQLKELSSICPSSKNIDIVNQIKMKLEEIISKLPEDEQNELIPKEKQEQTEDNGNIYLEEPIAVRQLTPRIYDEQQAAVLSKLRRKKQKLKKKIEIDLRKSVQVKQQEAQVLEEVRKQKSDRQYKKELLVIEKQTAEAKKFHNKMQKVKQIQKGKGKDNKGFSLKSRLDKLSQRKKKK